MPTAIYPGSLDPITYGHTGAIRDTTAAFSHVQVAIGINPKKDYLFALSEREALARAALKDLGNVSVTSFSGLLVHHMVRNGLDIVVRGVRNGTDLDDAMLQETIGWQQLLAQDIKAFYVPARGEQGFISSTALKAVLATQGDATHLAPPSTLHATQARLMGQYFYGITGPSGSGKSTLCRKFAEIAEKRGIPLTHVDMDKLGHAILGTHEGPLYNKTRKEIARAFGKDVLNADGFVNRKILGGRVFGQTGQLEKLNAIIHGPIYFDMSQSLIGKKGLILVDAALIAETNRSAIVNHNILVTDAAPSVIAARLRHRDQLNGEQLTKRITSQWDAARKLTTLRDAARKAGYGDALHFKSKRTTTDADFEAAFDTMLQQVDIFGELRITAFFKQIGVRDPNAAYTTLRKLYGGNDRFYHALSHIVDGLNQMPGFIDQVEDRDAFTLGWLFHDAVYDARAKGNEEASAALMLQLGQNWGIDSALLARAEKFILATRHGKVQPTTPDEEFLVDLDMSILGRNRAIYDLYEQQVRREYGHLTDAQWAAGRGQFFDHMAHFHYHTPYFADRYEAPTRRNIERSQQKLVNSVK